MEKKVFIPRKLMTERKWYSSDAHFRTEASYADYKTAHKRIYGKKAVVRRKAPRRRASTGLSFW